MKLLADKKILITRSREQSLNEINLLEENRAEVIDFPTISICPLEDYSSADNEIKAIDAYDFLILTSMNAAEHFIGRLKKLEVSLPAGTKLICVGAKTEEYCESNGLKVDSVPSKFSAKGILEELKGVELKEKLFLIPVSCISKGELALGLKEKGAIVKNIVMYDVKARDRHEKHTESEIERIMAARPDVFIFSSPSSYHSYLTLFEIESKLNYFDGSVIAVIGESTKSAIEKSGLKVDVMPEKFTIEATVEKLLEYFNRN